MHLRTEQRDDHESVRDIHRQAFGEHGPVVADLVDSLRQLLLPDEGLSLVAEAGDRLVGHAMVTPSLLDAPTRLVDVQVLSPVGVLPERQGAGVGSSLVRACLQAAEEQGAPLLFVEGDPNYYSRFGFTRGGELGFRRPSLRIPDAAFQVQRLPTYESWMVGTLVYSHVFWDHDSVGLRGERLARAESQDLDPADREN